MFGRSSPRPESAFRKLFRFGEQESLLEDFHARARLRFFFHPRNRKDFFLQLLTGTQSLEEILSEATDTMENRFDTLGSGKIDLGETVPWRKDFLSGREWPLRRLSVQEILDLERPSDIKVPWELSRFHQVWWLGKAYWITGNEEFAKKFAGLTEDWIKANPPGEGPNWSVAMEAAIRASNWIAGYYFFCESKSLSPEFWSNFMRSLAVHGSFIESHLEFSSVNGNHLLSNVVGLIYLGIFFQDCSFGKRWKRWGVSQLETEMNEQVYEDGVDHEHSTSYHRLVLELFSSGALLCRRNNVHLSEHFWQRLELMFEFVLSYTRPDGSIPLIGDSDDGRLFRISMNQEINDHRHALSVGAVLFKRPDFKLGAGRFDQETLWYFGGEGFETHQMLREGQNVPGSRDFPQAGFYIMRTDDTHVFIDAGEIGLRGRGGHGHNDTLSFELWARGKPFLVDSGTYTYTRDPGTRRMLQGTSAHNTMMIDDTEIANWPNLWSIQEDRTNPRVLEWTSDAETDILEAEHFGYAHLAQPVVHRRKFLFKKSTLDLLLTDTVTGNGPHTIQLRFHFHPQVSLERQEKNTYLAVCGTERIRITCSEPAEIVETLYSPSYGVLLQSRGLQIRLHTAIPHTITTRITLI